MRHIKIEELKSVYDTLHGTGEFAKWEAKAKLHLEAIAKLEPSERSKYWSKNNIWSDLYDALSELSCHKCWYTESKENSSEWQVDHFRPKAKSLDENGDIILENGYWWLSYYWRNLRLSGSLCNLLRKDRFRDEDTTFGKGNFFPLKDKGRVSKENDLRCRGEIPMLLDPTISRDVSLISFDQDGSPFPSFNKDDSSHNYDRAIISIKCFGLVHQPLVRGRKRVWDECESIVELTNNDLKLNIDDDEFIDEAMENCFQRLADLAARSQPFSMIVFNFIQEKINKEDYNWLVGALKAIA